MSVTFSAGKAKAVFRRIAESEQIAARLAKGPAVQSPRLREALPLLQSLQTAHEVGQLALRVLESGQAPNQFARLSAAATAHAACELPEIAPLKLLVAAAAEQNKRAKLSAAGWQQLLQNDVAAPAR